MGFYQIQTQQKIPASLEEVWNFISVPTQWITEITHVKDFEYFVDEQRVGPYSIWHHEHHIQAIRGGVMMKDIVSYKPPYGVLGSVANSLFIRKKLDEIFTYRTKAVEQIFGKWEEEGGQ